MAWKKILLEGDAALLSDNAPVNVDHAAASAGSAADAGRRDHKHDLDEGVVGTLKAVDGTAATLGTNNAVPHLDHIHALGPLVANLNANQKQMVGMVVHVALTGPNAASEAEGQVWYNNNTGSQHAYIWVP